MNELITHREILASVDFGQPLVRMLRQVLEAQGYTVGQLLRHPHHSLWPYREPEQAILLSAAHRETLARNPPPPLMSVALALESLAVSQASAIKVGLLKYWCDIKFNQYGARRTPRFFRDPLMRALRERWGTELVVFRQQLIDLLDFFNIPSCEVPHILRSLVTKGKITAAEEAWMARLIRRRGQVAIWTFDHMKIISPGLQDFRIV